MTTDLDIRSLTDEQIKMLQDEAQDIYARTDKRRVHKLAKNLKSIHRFDCWQSNIGIIMTVDQVTSGRFHWDVQKRVLAFQYPSDLTAFLLAYTPDPPILRAQ